MTTLEQKQRAATSFSISDGYEHGVELDRRFIAGAEWAEAQQRWIPVTERLPEEGQRVLFVIDLPGSYLHGIVYSGSYTRNGAFSTLCYRCNASYWQPSPEPPAQEGGQDE